MQARIVLAFLLLGTAACRVGATHAGRYLDRRLATPRAEGVRCYRATAHLLHDTLAGPPSPYERRWIVLDSRAVHDSSEFRDAFIVSAQGRDWPVSGVWRPIGDSIHVDETSAFVGARWVLAEEGEWLVGHGYMVHDVVAIDPAGRRARSRSEWPARGERISCHEVP